MVVGRREGSGRRVRSGAIAGLMLPCRWYSDIRKRVGSIVLLPVVSDAHVPLGGTLVMCSFFLSEMEGITVCTPISWGSCKT